MGKRTNRLYTWLVYAILWGMVWTYPVLEETMNVMQGDSAFSWTGIRHAWTGIVPFFLLFLLHRLLLLHRVRAYRLSAVDYLLKPFDLADFQRAANKLLTYSRPMSAPPVSPEAACLLVKEGYKYLNLRIADILYAKAMSDYVRIYLAEGKPVTASITLKQLKERLPECFCQIHRSYIVNMNRIREIERSCIVIDKETRLAVGDNYRKEFQEYLKRHSLGGGKGSS